MVDGKDIRRSKEMRGSTESYLPGLTMGQLEAKNLMLSVLEEVEARIEEWSTHTASLRTMADALFDCIRECAAVKELVGEDESCFKEVAKLLEANGVKSAAVLRGMHYADIDLTLSDINAVGKSVLRCITKALVQRMRASRAVAALSAAGQQLQWEQQWRSAG